MRKLRLLFVLLAAFAWNCSLCSAISVRTLVYKGSIKASKSIFYVDDTNNLISGTINGYWVVVIADVGVSKGTVLDSNAVVYDSRDKYYKVIPGGMQSDPCDPCAVVLLDFEAVDAGGEFWFDVVGKGKLTKYTDEEGAGKDFVPTSLKGTGFINDFAFFNPDYTVKGPVTASLKLDSRWTRYANTNYYYEDIINEIVAELTRKGGWTEWTHVPSP